MEGQSQKGGDNTVTIGIRKGGPGSQPTRSTGYTTGAPGYSTTVGMSHMLGGDPLSFDGQLQETGGQHYRSGAQSSLFPASRVDEFTGGLDLAKALCEMCELEGQLEQKRRELALRSDFNMCDVFKMLTQLKAGKRGADCDDLYATMVHNLELVITRDEVFILFYKLDKDGDGVLSYSEVCDCFVPREEEYAALINSRGGFYGDETDPRKLFEDATRALIKRFVRGFVECEVSMELVRQRIVNTLAIKPAAAFVAIDAEEKGCLEPADLRAFLKGLNMYPSEKNLNLLFLRLDKSERGALSLDDFKTGVEPFSLSQQ